MKQNDLSVNAETKRMGKRIVVFSGAGVSKESGLATYRDLDGLWSKYDPRVIATPEGFAKHTEFVLNFYNKMRSVLMEQEPNHAHRAIAALEKDYDVTIITQNIDNLHERAGSSKVIHLHGELMKVTSSYEPLNADFIEDRSLDIPLKVGDKAKDGSQLRPFIVWFGEALGDLTPAVKAMEEADVLLVIGTSLKVMPAAGLINYAPNTAKKYCIDPNDLPLPAGMIHIKQPATKGIDVFAKEIAR